MKITIFANGQIDDLPSIDRSLFTGASDNMIIAADGGAIYCEMLGIIPQVAIGDFDSLDENRLNALQNSGTVIIRYPRNKDFTDLELALQYAVEQGADEIYVYGALGQRWDMTLANLLLPASKSLKQSRIWLMDGLQRITLLSGGQSLDLWGEPGDIVSLIPIGGDANGLSTDGLQYPLQNESLMFGASRGVSNVLLDHHAWIKMAEGQVICTHIEKIKSKLKLENQL